MSQDAEGGNPPSPVQAVGTDFRNVDVESLQKFNALIKLDKSNASAEDKAQGWRRLAGEEPKFALLAGRRAAQWERYAARRPGATMTEEQRIAKRDSDWKKLSALLLLDETVVSQASKMHWAEEFLKTYRKSPGIESQMAEALIPFVKPGAVQNGLRALALVATEEARSRTAAVSAQIQWVWVAGGSFWMGSDLGRSDARPQHRVHVESFQMAKNPVTFQQYQLCVEAGACPAAHVSDGTCWLWTGSKWEQGTLPPAFQGDDHPVVCVDWNQAQAFAKWVGGRLPTEAEWEYAARGAGKNRQYPWGDEEATCARAVFEDGGPGCGHNSTWPVCSKPDGNTEQGLCDMAGNIWQFLQDRWHDSYSEAPADGSAWEQCSDSVGVVRGGSWNNLARVLPASYRRPCAPAFHYDSVGLRPVRTLGAHP